MRENNPKLKETFAYKTFGKAYHNLTDDEKRLFRKLIKRERYKDPIKKRAYLDVVRQWQKNNPDKIKVYKEKTLEHRKDYFAEITRKRRELRDEEKARTNDYSLREALFGNKKLNDLTLEEKRFYNKIRSRLRTSRKRIGFKERDGKYFIEHKEAVLNQDFRRTKSIGNEINKTEEESSI